MTDTVMDKDRLAAFVDGELSPEEAAQVVMHLADTPEDQAFVDDLVAANETLAAAFAAPLAEPVPPGILAAIQGTAATGQVVPFRRPAVPFRAPMWAAGGALAAALAVLAVLPRGADAPSAFLTPGPVAVASALHQALQSQPSGVPQSAGASLDVQVLATFGTADGRHCREIEAINRASGILEMAIACQSGAGGWLVEVALAEPIPPQANGGFLTASGPEGQAMSEFLDRIGAGLALDPDAEAALLARDWAP